MKSILILLYRKIQKMNKRFQMLFMFYPRFGSKVEKNVILARLLMLEEVFDAIVLYFIGLDK